MEEGLVYYYRYPAINLISPFKNRDNTHLLTTESIPVYHSNWKERYGLLLSDGCLVERERECKKTSWWTSPSKVFTTCEETAMDNGWVLHSVSSQAAVGLTARLCRAALCRFSEPVALTSVFPYLVHIIIKLLCLLCNSYWLLLTVLYDQIFWGYWRPNCILGRCDVCQFCLFPIHKWGFLGPGSR